jgi:hypothetical protein
MARIFESYLDGRSRLTNSRLLTVLNTDSGKRSGSPLPITSNAPDFLRTLTEWMHDMRENFDED